MKEDTTSIINFSKETLNELKGLSVTAELCAIKTNSVMLIKILENQIILNDKLDKLQKTLTIIERNVI